MSKAKPTTPTEAPSPFVLANLIDEALTLREEIIERQTRLKIVEAQIELAALKGPHEPLKDDSREGRQFLAKSRTGRVLPVIFTSDALIKSFLDQSEKHHALEALAGGDANLRRLFKPPTKWESMWEDGQKFRAAATELLGPPSVAFIKACRQVDKSGLAKSVTKMDYENAK
jgi:hypothetical protein